MARWKGPTKSKEELRGEVQTALQAIEDGVASLKSGDDWKRMLKFASNFHTYSYGNMMLIAAQNPNATRVAGFNTWKKVGRYVKAGEHGLRILAPMYKVKEVEDEDGDVERKRLAFFRLVSVFDVSQTAGDPLPTLVTKLGGKSAATTWAWGRMAKWLKRNHVGVDMVGGLGETGGYWIAAENRIVINADNAPAHQARTLVHETAHMIMHTPAEYRKLIAAQQKFATVSERSIIEVEAESVAYVVMSTLGVPAGSYSFGYVAGWSKGKTEVVRAAATRIQTAATYILRDILAIPDPLDEARGAAGGPPKPKKNPAALPTLRGWDGMDEIGYAIETGYWDGMA
jgi:antirestriction protein ArdC